MSICKLRNSALLFCTFAVFGAALGAVLAACDPYNDSGEFLAGPVYGANFVSGVQVQQSGANPLAPVPVIARGSTTAYSLANTAGTSTATVSSSNPATSPFWTNGTRDPLAVTSIQHAYVFDGPCQAPDGYSFVANLDLIRQDMQYPIFEDIPEVLSGDGGEPGRTTPPAYSAILLITHIAIPPSFPCQSLKRYTTVQTRLLADLKPGATEYRLYQVFDPALTLPPTPYQLGFYNQLVVPFIDMGPVPMTADGSHFQTMPLYHLVDSTGNPLVDANMNPLPAVVVGGPTDPAVAGVPAYSPICLDTAVTVPAGMVNAPPLDASNPLYQTGKSQKTLSSCIVCGAVDPNNINTPCPFNQGYVTSGVNAL